MLRLQGLIFGIAVCLFSSLFSAQRYQMGYTELFIGPTGYFTALNVKNTTSSETGFTGGLWGASMGINYYKPDRVYWGVDFEFGAGNLTNGTSSSRYIHMDNVQGLLGYNLAISLDKSLVFTPFGGLGFRYLVQYMHDVTDLHYFYRTYYVPVGAIVQYFFGSYASLGAMIAVRINIDETLQISSLKGSYWILTQQIDLDAKLPFKIFLGKKKIWEIGITPSLHKMTFGKPIAQTNSGITLAVDKEEIMCYGATIVLGARF